MPFGWLLSGVGFLALNPLLILLALSHLEMLNARKLVRGVHRSEIDAREKRHDVYGTIGALVVVAILALVTFVRLG